MSHWGHFGGLSALAGAYFTAGILALADGPLPFGDAVAVGILAVPDPIVYGIGYTLAEGIGHSDGAYSYAHLDKRPKAIYDYSHLIG